MNDPILQRKRDDMKEMELKVRIERALISAEGYAADGNNFNRHHWKFHADKLREILKG